MRENLLLQRPGLSTLLHHGGPVAVCSGAASKHLGRCVLTCLPPALTGPIVQGGYYQPAPQQQYSQQYPQYQVCVIVLPACFHCCCWQHRHLLCFSTTSMYLIRCNIPLPPGAQTYSAPPPPQQPYGAPMQQQNSGSWAPPPQYGQQQQQYAPPPQYQQQQGYAQPNYAQQPPPPPPGQQQQQPGQGPPTQPQQHGNPIGQFFGSVFGR